MRADIDRAVREDRERIPAEKVELIVMSVGALLLLNVKSMKVHFASGTIGGLDVISAAAFAGIEVVLTTRKSPSILNANRRKQDLVYEGTAKEAVKLSPREMNVAATLALIAGPEKVKVHITSDALIDRNVREIEVKWKHGNMLLMSENDPHPENPRTSALAAWSAIELLKELLEKHA